MPNMASVIQNHNTSLLKNPTLTDIKECRCRRKPECPLDKKCLSGYLQSWPKYFRQTSFSVK